MIWIEQIIEKKTKNRIKKPRFNDDAISVQQIFGSLYSLFRLVFKSTSFSCNWFVKFGPRKTVKEKLRSGKEKTGYNKRGYPYIQIYGNIDYNNDLAKSFRYTY